MRKCFLLASALVLVSFAASAQVAQGTIDSISPDGDVITMDDGSEYQTPDDTSSMNEGDSAVVTSDGTMVDTDSGDEISVDPQ